MRIHSKSFPMGGRIPERCAYGLVSDDGALTLSENLNPELSWADVPEGTRSFVLACLDDDVPTVFEPSEPSGELSPALARRRFVHWVQIDCPAEVRGLEEGALSNEKKLAAGYGRPGINDYSRGATPEPGATGTGYDGPCPPHYDARWHFYRWQVFALDVERLEVPEAFLWADVEAAMKGHVLDAAEWVGHYSRNPHLAR